MTRRVMEIHGQTMAIKRERARLIKSNGTIGADLDLADCDGPWTVTDWNINNGTARIVTDEGDLLATAYTAAEVGYMLALGKRVV